MRSIHNDCVGCPQGCIHCGRDEDYWIITCDLCHAEIDENNVHSIGNKDYCEVCYIRKSMTDEEAFDIVSGINYEEHYFDTEEIAAIKIMIDALKEKIRG